MAGAPFHSSDGGSGPAGIAVSREQLLAALVDCDRERARSAIDRAVRSGLAPEGVLSRLIHPVMDRLGEMWGAGEVALTQLFLAACAVEDVAQRLAEKQSASGRPGPRVVLGTLVDGHHLGARLVGTFLRTSGAEVIDVGAELSPTEMVAHARDKGADVLAVSVFLLRSVRYVSEIQKLLSRDGGKIKLAVGGAPFRADPDLARRVATDCWAPDAVRAALAIRNLVNGRRL